MVDNQPPPSSSPARPRLIWLVSLAVVIVLLLTGGIWALTRSPSSGRASGPETSLTPTAVPTPTPTPAPPRVVYTANWLHGAGGWVLPPSVQVKSGQLVLTGASDINLTIPYQAPVTGYTVTVTMEIDSVSSAAEGGAITIAGQDASGKSQYYVQFTCNAKRGTGCHGGQSSVGTEGGVYPSGLEVADFNVGPHEVTYQVNVDASSVQFCVGLACQSADFVSIPTGSLKLVLEDNYLQMVVTSVSVSIP